MHALELHESGGCCLSEGSGCLLTCPQCHHCRFRFAFWGAVLGLIVGVGVGAYAMFARLAGKIAFVPLVLIPLCVWFAWWLGQGWIDASWDNVKQVVEASSERSQSLGHVGHVGRGDAWVIWIILVPMLIYALGPSAVSVVWAVFVTLFVPFCGFVLGTVLSAPPVLVVVAVKTARFAERVKQTESEGTVRAVNCAFLLPESGQS